MTASLEALENVFDGGSFNGTIIQKKATIGTIVQNKAIIGSVILNGAQRSEESVPINRVLQRTIVVVMVADPSLSLRMTASLEALENVFDGGSFNGTIIQNKATIGTIIQNKAIIGSVILNGA